MKWLLFEIPGVAGEAQTPATLADHRGGASERPRWARLSWQRTGNGRCAACRTAYAVQGIGFTAQQIQSASKDSFSGTTAGRLKFCARGILCSVHRGIPEDAVWPRTSP